MSNVRVQEPNFIRGLKPVITNYFPYSVLIAGQMIPYSTPIGAETQMLVISKELLDKDFGNTVYGTGNKINQVSTQEKVFAFAPSSFLLELPKNVSDTSDFSTVYTDMQKNLTIKWDAYAYQGMLENSSDNIVTLASGTQTVQEIINTISEMKATFEDNLAVNMVDPSSLVIGVSPLMDLFLNQISNSSGLATTNRDLVAKAHPDVYLIKMPRPFYNEVKDTLGLGDDDLFMEAYFTPNLVMHMGMMPAVYNEGIDERRREQWIQWAYQTSTIQVFKKSVIRKKFTLV